MLGHDDLLVPVPRSAPGQCPVDFRSRGAHQPDDVGAEVAEDHAGHACRETKTQFAHADGDLHHRQATTRLGVGGLEEAARLAGVHQRFWSVVSPTIPTALAGQVRAMVAGSAGVKL